MKLRTLVLTVALLAILSAVAWFVQRPGPPPSKDSRIGQPLIDRATVEKARKLRVSDQGKSVTLARQPDSSWRVVSYHDFPADFSKLSRFVGDLTDTKVQRFVTANSERLDRLEFKDTKIELLDASDQPTWSLTLGKYAETGGGRFIRFDDEKKAYLANLSAWIDPDAKNWADSQLVNLKPDEIAKLEVDFPGGAPLAISRAKKGGDWTSPQTPAGQKVNAGKVGSILSSLDALHFTDTADLADPKLAAAKPHTRTFKLTTFDGTTYAFDLARKPEEKKLKPPSPTTDGKSGPAALGSVEDLAKKQKEAKAAGKSGEAKKPGEQKPLAPEYETIPAGPVFVSITSSQSDAPLNALMKKRAFEVSDYVFTSLPEKSADLFQAAPPPAPAKPAAQDAAAKPPSEPQQK
ncbi:MAG TPA: DUF4340 domain-containing protein [Opitutus sp.]|nr:DUF4340 domain-containing protein [Opitutus sp.]